MKERAEGAKERLKIAVDCYEVTQELTGVGRVIHNILLSLCREEDEYEFLAFSRQKVEDYSKYRNIKQYVLPGDKGYFRWQNGPFYRGIKEYHPELLIAPNYTLPLFVGSKSILFEHDVSFASHPEWFPKKEVWKRRYFVKRSLGKASLIVTLSEASKQEIIRHYSVSPKKIKVLYLGAGRNFKPAGDTEVSRWKEKKGIKSRRVIGFLGSIFNRRNIPLLVEAVRHLRKEFPEVVLYIVGKDMTYPPQDMRRILNEDWILWEESMQESELPLYFSVLDAFAYLSEYEGFGLPPLEALSCGTVPILLKRSALAEVYSEFSLMAENADAGEIRSHLRSALEDLDRMDVLLRAFKKKRAYFSWDRVAGEFGDAMNEVLCGK